MNKEHKHARTERIKWERVNDLRLRVIPVLGALGQRGWIRKIVVQPREGVLLVHLFYDEDSILFRFGTGFCEGFDAWVEILVCDHWESMQESHLARQRHAMRKAGFNLVSYDSSFVLRMELDDLGAPDEVRSILKTLVAKRMQLLNEFEVSRCRSPPDIRQDRCLKQAGTQTAIS